MIKINKKTQKPASTRGEQIKKRADAFVINSYKQLIKPFSRFFRQVFEFSHIRQIFGVLVVSSFLSTAILPSSLSAIQTKIETNFSEIELVDPTVIETEQSVRLPVDNFIVSQSYSLFHPGIDLAAIKGSPVYPIMEGKAILVSLGKYGYGNHVIVDHQNGYKTLYAHLAKIEVKEGESVTHDSILGLIGSTGRSTGPHLHLQVLDNGNWTNPKAFLEGYFGQKLASTR